jgi:hypothetical protein
VSCACTLAELVGAQGASVVLVSATATVKVPRNLRQWARTLVQFDVAEAPADTLAAAGVRVVRGVVHAVDTATHTVRQRLPYRPARP